MATFTPQIPPSVILKSKDKLQDEGPRRQTKEEYRRMKELEEARKAGTVPAMTDVETGSDINPHIPHYIAQAPWYISASGPTLKHQRPHEERKRGLADINEWYKRGVTNRVVTKYRKGACENCGAMTHTKKDCFERPRKILAKFSGEDIAPDDVSQADIELSYDAKRDRWNGFDPVEYNLKAVEEFKRFEEARKTIKAESLEEEYLIAKSSENGEEREVKEEEKEVKTEKEKEDFDEDKYAENAAMPGVKLDTDSRTRITVRNLRIREDTAKYLYNLDLNSAYYDPKSRAMRENPFKESNKAPEEVPFAGDNFTRYTGEVVTVNKTQLFAWEAHKRGAEVHALAEPTKLELLKKEYTVRKENYKHVQEKNILEKYGGEEYLRVPPKDLLLAQTEAYVEYSRTGKVVKGMEKPAIKSRYDEDVFVNNHKSVWGSYWTNGQWGYACCHNTVKNSYCIGEAGKTLLSVT
ncbi:unnamed protein product [Soboliphyme baturini]|uniref:Pre-mRNA-splicing factor SLU7 n=1 Tax=Soboliphyme baturini TaxID=241478 RepID=A0A183IBH1_9BILA|nr:unnamed protein product [Soboliphyme baturini]